MKYRKYILAAAVIIIVVATATFFAVSHQNPNNPAEKVYGLNDEIAITDCTGDTDILRAEAIVNRLPSTNGQILQLIEDVKIKFTVSRPVALTSTEFKNGKAIGNGYWDSGTIERFENNKWVKYSALKARSQNIIVTQPNRDAPYAQLTYNTCTATVNLPVTEPGKYRLTYKFRDILSTADWEYTTGEQVYSISHTVTVPDASDEKYDVANVFFGETVMDLATGGSPAPYVAMAVVPVVRANDGSQFYYDKASYRLEALVDGQWVEAPAPDGWDSAVLNPRYTGPGQFVSPDSSHGAYLYLADRELEYRLTFDLTEERDADAERVNMQVRLNFK